MKKDLQIGLIELFSTVDGTLWGSRLKDLYSLVRLPSRGTELLAAILRNAGYTSVETFNPRYNRYGGRFHKEELKALASMDVVGISSISRTQPPSYELARNLKALNPEIKIVFGGPHVSSFPEEGLENSGDVVVRREGDATIVELMERFGSDLEDPSLADVQGISFRDRQGEVIPTPDRPFLTSEELTQLPFPELPPLVRKKITHNMIVTSRGCPFQCDFCAVITHFGDRFRAMDVERTVDLIEHNLRQTHKPIFFGDDNFNANPTRTRAVLERILQKGLSMPIWGAQLRVEAANDKELLALMRKAGCERLYVGFESVNEETLRLYNKKSTLKKNEESIRRFNEAGFLVHGMFVLGSDEDTLDTIQETVKFAKQSMLSTAQFFPLTALPGTPMTDRYGKEGRILSRNWHYYDAHHVVVRPAKIAPHVLQRETELAHLSFYSTKEAFRFLFFSSRKNFHNFIIRIFGNILSRRIIRQLQPYLRQLEALDEWSEEMESRHQRLKRQLGSKVQSLGRGLSQTAGPVRTSVDEFVRWLRKSLEVIPQEFLPYCQRYIKFKTGTSHKALKSEESFENPISSR